jgi:predicted component of type VI protein secretion system
MIKFMKLWLTVLCVVSLIGCSQSTADKQPKPAPSVPARTTASNKSNPLAKYIELVGVRANEKSPGHLQVQFGVVNHSEADIGDVKLDVTLGTTAAKAGDPPLITFSTKVPALGPNEMKQVSVDVPTKLRVYELPDWQFLKADFQIGDLQ